MDTYRTMMIASQARRAHARREPQQVQPREAVQPPLPVLAQVVVGALLSLSLAATYTAKVIFNNGGSVHPPTIALALAALVMAGLLAGGGWRVVGQRAGWRP